MKTTTDRPPKADPSAVALAKAETVNVTRAPLAIVHISDQNTRHPKPAEVTELTQSMKQFGQTTPAIGRPHPKKKGHIELAAGARRRVAAEAAGLDHLDVIVKEMNDDVFEETILIENLQREDPDPRAEVKLLDRLVKRGIATSSAISAHLGKPEHWVARRLRLLKVIPEIRKQWESGRRNRFSDYNVEMMELLGSLNEATQTALFKDQQAFWLNHPNSRAELQKELEKHIFCNLAHAPFDLNDPKFFVKGCGPGCASDSSKQSDLFDMTNKDARCLNCSCFNARLGKWRKAQLDELREKHGIKKDLPLMLNDQSSYNSERIRVGDQVYTASAPDYGHKLVAEKPDKGEAQQVYVTNTHGTKFRVAYLVKGQHRTRKSEPSGDRKKLSPTEARKKGRDMLEARRWDIVRKDLIQRVFKSTAKDVTEDIVDLVVIFGTCQYHNPERGDRKDPNTNWEAFDQCRKKGYRVESRDGDEKDFNYGVHDCIHNSYGSYEIDEKTFKDRKEALWHVVKPVIVNQLLGAFRVLNIVEENIVYDIERVGKLIGFDTKTAKREADLTIPPPKSWGKVDVHTLEPLTAKDALQSIKKKLTPTSPSSPSSQRPASKRRS